MKKRKRIAKAWIVLILTPLVLLGASSLYRYLYDEYEKKLYPLPERYVSTIEKYSDLYDVPAEILCGVIKVESSFDPSAVSRAGAKGIMQITDETFDWLQFRAKEEHDADELFDYKINIKFGSYFLSLLYEEFGDWDVALAAYNAGRSRVAGWLDDEEYSEDGKKLTNIPYKETANYVVKVKKSAEYYKKIYFTTTHSE